MARPLGAQVAFGGEAGEQGGLGMRGGLQRAICERLGEHLIVPQRLVVRMQEQVRVQIDQAGSERGAGQGDALGIRRRLDAVGRTDRGDLAVVHQHRPAGMRGVAVGGPHAVGQQQGILRRCIGGDGQRCGGQQRGADRGPDSVTYVHRVPLETAAGKALNLVDSSGGRSGAAMPSGLFRIALDLPLLRHALWATKNDYEAVRR
jgi:hypothetical protein